MHGTRTECLQIQSGTEASRGNNINGNDNSLDQLAFSFTQNRQTNHKIMLYSFGLSHQRTCDGTSLTNTEFTRTHLRMLGGLRLAGVTPTTL